VVLGLATLVGTRAGAQAPPTVAPPLQHVQYAVELLQQAPVQQRDFAAQQLYDVLVAAGPADDATGGATLEPVDDSLRAQLDLPKGQGLVVASLNPDSPAAQVGLQANDILLKLAETSLAAPDDVTKALKQVGEKEASLEIIRGGKRQTLQVRPRYKVMFGPAHTGKRDFYIGVPVRPLDDAMRSHLNLPGGQGLVATEIIADSPAAKAGLKAHDILMKLSDKLLPDTETLVAQIQASEGKPVDLEVVRAGKPITIKVTPERRPATNEESAQAHAAFRMWHPYTLNDRAGVWVNAAPDQARLQQQLGVMHHGAAALAGGTSPIDKKLDALMEEIKQLRKEVEALRKANR
jgi:membrane-associated protease RseP (regulator of RpoE activity)